MANVREQGAGLLTDSMFVAAADALAARTVAANTENDSLYPPLRNLRIITRDIAGTAARESRDVGVGRDLTDEQIEQDLDHEIWIFDYPTLNPI
jgi:malic enzyme